TRWITTFRKLHTSRPNTSTTTANRGFEAESSSITWALAARWVVLDHRAQLEDGQVHRNDEAADEHAQDGHDQRLEQARHRVHGVVHLGLEEGRDLAGHLVLRAGFLTHGDHLDHHVGEEVGVFHGALQARAGGDFVADREGGVLVDDVAGGAGDGFHGFDEGDAGCEHGGKGAGETRHGRFVHDWTDDRQFQGDPVDGLAQFARALVEVAERKYTCADHNGDEDALGLHELRQVDHRLREGRQVRTEALE